MSTRCPKKKYKFIEGERVLCYEPDHTKAKVLYDSKVIGVCEVRDKKRRKRILYKIHFQGWNSSWDRKVSCHYILKDTERNRQLQKDLAEKAQSQLAAYLYRKERKRTCLSSGQFRPKDKEESSLELDESSMDFAMKDNYDNESESYSSSVESGTHEEERVLLRISGKLKEVLEYDHEMIVKKKNQHILPAKVTTIQILENFVKQSAFKLMLTSNNQSDNPRRRINSRNDKREKDFEKLMNIINLLKEVADGIRIYFDYTIKNHLLYAEEKEYTNIFMETETWKNYSYSPSIGLSPEFLLSKSDTENIDMVEEPGEKPQLISGESNQKRRLRSYKAEDDPKSDGNDNNNLSIGSPRSGRSITPPKFNSSINSTSNLVKSLTSVNLNIPPHVKEFLQKILSWQILPAKAEPEASMFFGATHLARLIVRFPEFLNASAITDEKLKILLRHLDSFVGYLESHKEWFGEQNYTDNATCNKNV